MKTPRADWFYRRAVYPLRDSDPSELEAFWKNPDRFPSIKHDNWLCLGPANYAGRVTSLIRDEHHLYAGTAAGGVWRSKDEGRSWSSIWPAHLSQNIGALAHHPSRPGYLLCATGEGNLSTATYPGSGIYCSEDGGETWTAWLSSEVSLGFAADEIPRRIASAAVAIGPAGNPVIAFGAVAKDETHPAGLFLQKDTILYGGRDERTDRFVTRWGVRSYNCHSVVYHPTTPDLLYVAIEPRGTQNGIWRTEDNGLTWEHLNPRGLPKGEICGRISLAISPSQPDTLYAVIADTGGRFHGVYRTDDRGDTWHRSPRTPVIAGETDLRSNCVIAVHPGNPDVVVFGASSLYLSQDGGKSWAKLVTPALVSGHHALLLSGPPDKPVIFTGNDAGVAASRDGGLTWENRSKNLVSAMFYNLAVSPVDSELYGGGAQDTGALLRSGNTDNFSNPFKGDGGLLVFDPVNPHAAYGTNASGRVYRHRTGSFKTGWTSTAPEFTTAEKKLRALFPLAIRPARGRRPLQCWLATNRLWFTPDDRRPFRPASRRLDNSAISTMAFSASDQDTIIAGTTDGGVFRLEAVEDVWFWSSNLAGPLIPARLITQIRFHPAEPATIVLCVGASSAPVANLSGNRSPFSHVFRSRDRGATWEDIDGGKLPNVAFNTIVYETREPYRIFAGGDLGVWAYDRGHWTNISGNLPNVIISDLDYHAKDHVLTAATFGRGLWRLSVPKLPARVTPPKKKTSAGKPATAGSKTPRRSSARKKPGRQSP